MTQVGWNRCSEKNYLTAYAIGGILFAALIAQGWRLMPSPYWSVLLFVLLLPAVIPALLFTRWGYSITLIIGLFLTLATHAVNSPNAAMASSYPSIAVMYIAAAIGCEVIYRYSALLRRNLTLLDKLFNAAPNAIACLDRDLNLILSNVSFEELFDLTDNKLASIPDFDVKNLNPSIQDALIAVRDHAKSQNAYLELLKGLPRDRPGSALFDWSLYPIVDRIGNVETIVLSISDATERLNALNSYLETHLAAERQRVMQESFGAVSHHLSQPITVISGNLSLLQKTKYYKDDAHIRRIIRNCQLAVQQLSDLLVAFQENAEYSSIQYTGSTYIIRMPSPTTFNPKNQEMPGDDDPSHPRMDEK